jgi:nucleotide-binding universal stress UspA family protein
MSEKFSPPSIVVGIDGSRGAVHAALWAIDEAVSREVPLRLLSVTDTPDGQAAAEAAVRAAAAAVEETGRAIRLETQVIVGAPTPTLIDASATAAMICIGAEGLKHFDRNRVGSTAATLVTSARCPVAVVRGAGLPGTEGAGWVVVELDETPDSAAVLQFGVTEARLRNAALRVLGSWQSRYTDIHDSHAVADGNRLVRAQLDRRLSHWKHLYPDLDVRPVAIHGSALTYLSKHAAEIGLVVVGAPNATGVGELLGPMGLTALHDTDCTILVVDRQRLL